MADARHKLGLILAVVAISGLPHLDCRELSPEALYDQAGRALDAGNAALAVKLYEELLRNAPDWIEARTNLGVALAQEGRYDEAPSYATWVAVGFEQVPNSTSSLCR